jgi:hypothetical protein
MVAACGGSSAGNVATHSPSPVQASPSQQTAASPSAQATPNPAPPPVTGAYGVLVSSQSAASYSISLVGVDGKVVASTQATTPTLVSCANAAGAPVPMPVSTSNSGAYFMDARGAVSYMSPGGQVHQAASVPAGTASRRSTFAVSPDDQRIAVVVADYTSSGASTRLYVEDLGGANHVDLFSQSGAFTLWPVGWHGTNNLVLAVVTSCTQGGGPFCGGMQELHVVDPATATRRFTIGNRTGCPIVGSPSPSGVVCWDGSQSKVLNWVASTVRTYPLQNPRFQYLSPNGGLIALVDNTGTTINSSNKTLPGVFACSWLDDTHVLAGGDSQHQARVADVGSGNIVPVAAQGDCAGRLPGGL